MKVTVLGCGTSSGVPRIGNIWGACDPAEPRNRRSRASILVESATTRILVDTGPDMRQQLLDADVGAIDAVIWTHDHADHCHGLDDIRQLFHVRGAPIPAFGRARHWRAGRAVRLRVQRPRRLSADHCRGRLARRSAGWRHPRARGRSAAWQHHQCRLRFEHGGRSAGYSTDFSAVTDEMTTLCEGLDLWIVDALRRYPHPTHPHLALTLAWIAECRPREAVLTHMDQSMDYRSLGLRTAGRRRAGP
jgi:phosphoribosyl 1,2-cyclic phosphate phosphodiesterase